MPTGKNAKLSLMNRMHAGVKLLICLGVAILGSIVIRTDSVSPLTPFILGWDIFCFCLLIFYWFSFFTTSQVHIAKQAAEDDPSRIIIFVIVLVCSAASMLAVILLLTAQKESSAERSMHVPLALLGMIFSWLTVHTLFTVRYAHIYYGRKKDDASSYKGGLDFPEDTKPDFLDFAYFSFVLGMTFQVSDVQISSKKLRRLALLHGLISFAYNTIIVALTINIIAGLGD
jgi:uncharacterized membrane protein